LSIHHHHGRRDLALASLGALGVVYGDIGTSPLYAFRESFHAGELAVVEDNVLGILSTMLWALIIVVTIKYLVFVMRADNHGEGGILALTALVSPTSRFGTAARTSALVMLGLFGTALLYGDGMITPAISVLSAVEGIEVAAPSLQPFVVPVAVFILVVLFSFQHRGTSLIGRLFGPVMVVWFAVLTVLGLVQVIADVTVLRAFDPTRAVAFFVGQPRSGFFALGAVFLVVTGAEALYADMGHFGKRPIRLGWFAVVMPALMVNYLGQGALLLSEPEAIDSPFFRLSPDWLLVPMIVLATAATVIASQALITGAFSLTMQAVQLGFLPRLKIDHTSAREFGQVYIGSVNYALMVACVALVVGFRSSSNLAAAYGIAVTTTMVITTVLLYRVILRRWRWPRSVAVALVAVFLAVDVAFFAANIVKIPAGGWVPLVIAAVVFAVMLVWRDGRTKLGVRLREHDPLPVERFIGSLAAHPQLRVPGTAVYLARDVGSAPPALLRNLRANEVIHETVVMVEVRSADEPRVQTAGRAEVHDLGDGFFQIRLTYGFGEQPDVPGALAKIVTHGFGFDPDDAVYFIGRETVLPSGRGWRRLPSMLYRVLHRNATGSSAYFQLPPERVFEVGMQVTV
jgi:KUP system potassium uptake protein